MVNGSVTELLLQLEDGKGDVIQPQAIITENPASPIGRYVRGRIREGSCISSKIQEVSTPGLLSLGAVHKLGCIGLLWGRPVHCRRGRSIPGLHP